MAVRLPGNFGGTHSFDKMDELISDIAAPELIAYWRNTLFTEASGAVSSWGSFGGFTASQDDVAKRPALASGVVTGDGVDDFLITDLNPFAQGADAGGYAAAAIKVGTVNTGSARYFMGSQETNTKRLVLGCGSTGLLQGFIGDAAMTAAGFPIAGETEVIGVGWDGSGSCELRRNGVVADTDTYTGSTANLVMMILARNFGVTGATGFNDWGSKGGAMALKSGGVPTGSKDSIDAALAAL